MDGHGSERPATPLRLDPDELATCVGCGLCLPHCPTYRVTGEEASSPRGRIAAMRGVESGRLPIDDEFVDFISTCVQCRGCEPACPSGVLYGHLVEDTRAALAEQRRLTSPVQRLAMRVLGHHRVLLAGSSALAVAQRVHLVPRRVGLSRLPLRRGPALRSTGDDVWLFTGCVMDAWQRETHRATQRMLTRAGFTSQVTDGAPCCGALHVHAGLEDGARALARQVIAAMPGDAPVIVNSAGCGAALLDYERTLGTTEGAAFSARVRDVHGFLAEHIDRLPPPRRRLGPVIVQDPCHLRHVQRAHLPVRTLLGLVADVVELDDEGLCCGAGGAYSALEPELAGEIRERKLAAIERAVAASGAQVVASANPGCAMHLAAAGLTVRHPIDLLDEAYS